jgi:4-carboxymuconolactone decarboxylase
MTPLTARERALVSLGAAMGSNCISCVEHHSPASRTAGLTDAQISEAIHLADKLRQVPARETLDAAVGLLAESTAPASTEAAGPGKPCCG